MILPSPRMRGWRKAMPLVAWILCTGTQAQGADAPRSAIAAEEMAKQVDSALVKAIGKTAALPSLTDDVTFLRRVSLDLSGKLPTPKEVEEFLADLRPDKRARKIDQ